MSVSSHNNFPGHGRLTGLVAIVTGGASPQGFGYAIAARYLSEGCHVLLGDISPAVSSSAESLSSANKSNNSSAQILAQPSFDVTTRASWDAAVSTCLSTWQRLDIVVNNAGTTYRNKPTLDVTEEEFDRVMAVNVKSIYHSVAACVPAIKKNPGGGGGGDGRSGGGSIINISSTGAVRPRPGLVWYNASKGAVSNATKGLAAEFGPDGIRVNAICPLLSATGLFSQFVGVEDTEENRRKFWEAIPLRRLTEPVDVANAAVFLASEEGRFCTGMEMEVDGGRCI